MKKGLKTALYVGLAGIAAYLGYTFYQSTLTDDKTDDGSSDDLGDTSSEVNEDGVVTQVGSDVEVISSGDGDSTTSPQVELDQPILLEGTKPDGSPTGIGVIVQKLANGVYGFTPYYNENDSALGINDSLLESVVYFIDGVNLGNFMPDVTILQEFQSSGTYPVKLNFIFAPSTQYQSGFAAEFNASFNVILDGGVVSLADYQAEIETGTPAAN
jgi:hypothetical protein